MPCRSALPSSSNDLSATGTKRFPDCPSLPTKYRKFLLGDEGAAKESRTDQQQPEVAGFDIRLDGGAPPAACADAAVVPELEPQMAVVAELFAEPLEQVVFELRVGMGVGHEAPHHRLADRLDTNGDGILRLAHDAAGFRLDERHGRIGDACGIGDFPRAHFRGDRLGGRACRRILAGEPAPSVRRIGARPAIHVQRQVCTGGLAQPVAKLAEGSQCVLARHVGKQAAKDPRSGGCARPAPATEERRRAAPDRPAPPGRTARCGLRPRATGALRRAVAISSWCYSRAQPLGDNLAVFGERRFIGFQREAVAHCREVSTEFGEAPQDRASAWQDSGAGRSEEIADRGNDLTGSITVRLDVLASDIRDELLIAVAFGVENERQLAAPGDQPRTCERPGTDRVPAAY